MRCLIILMFALLMPALGLTQSTAGLSDEDAALIALQELEGQNPDGQTLPPPDLSLIGLLDDDGKAALEDSLEQYFRYHETGYQHRRAVFRWQLLSTKLIFGAVMLIVALGLYFSWLEFNRDQKAGGGSGAVHQLEASAKGVKVSSPVLGVIILALSLGFFYLYLVYVYPIEELF